MYRILCFALILTWSGTAGANAETASHAVTAEDLFRLSLISDTQISPDGTRVAFVVARFDGPRDRYVRNVWLVGTDGATPRAFTSDGISSSPRWSPDGHSLAIVRVAAGIPQIALVDIRARTARFTTSLPAGATEPAWSHGGKHIAFIGITHDERPPARIDFTAAGFLPTAAQRTSDVRTIGIERYERSGVGNTYDTHKHVWIMDRSGRHARALSADPKRDDSAIAWSFDDAHIVFSSSAVDVPKACTSDLFTVSPDSGTPVRVVSANEANAGATFTHAGRVLSFAGNVEDLASCPALVSSDRSGGGA